MMPTQLGVLAFPLIVNSCFAAGGYVVVEALLDRQSLILPVKTFKQVWVCGCFLVQEHLSFREESLAPGKQLR
jgi:hypothetical protein